LLISEILCQVVGVAFSRWRHWNSDNKNIVTYNAGNSRIDRIMNLEVYRYLSTEMHKKRWRNSIHQDRNSGLQHM